jgi:hypothetical protein
VSARDACAALGQRDRRFQEFLDSLLAEGSSDFARELQTAEVIADADRAVGQLLALLSPCVTSALPVGQHSRTHSAPVICLMFVAAVFFLT